MKSIYLSLSMALVAALFAVGCGSTQTTPVATPGMYNGYNGINGGVPGAGLPYGSGNPYGGCYNAMPYGGYQNPYGNYSGYGQNCNQCPPGYMQSGAGCVVASGASGMCPYGTTWNSYSCQPTGFSGCPYGSSWSWQYQGACVGTVQNASGFQCSNYGGLYRCYYTGGAPYQGSYWNGYWYTRLSGSGSYGY